MTEIRSHSFTLRASALQVCGQICVKDIQSKYTFTLYTHRYNMCPRLFITAFLAWLIIYWGLCLFGWVHNTSKSWFYNDDDELLSPVFMSESTCVRHSTWQLEGLEQLKKTCVYNWNDGHHKARQVQSRTQCDNLNQGYMDVFISVHKKSQTRQTAFNSPWNCTQEWYKKWLKRYTSKLKNTVYLTFHRYWIDKTVYLYICSKTHITTEYTYRKINYNN